MPKHSPVSASSLGALNFIATWNATTNTPALVSSTGTEGDAYLVATGGTTTLDAESSWQAKDVAYFTNGVWNQLEGSVVFSNMTADTLAALNAIVSDGTLIDTADSRLSDARTPTAHDFAGAEHNADTLADVNTKISDATLIDTGDSRLSDARTPTAHDFAGAEHNADTLADVNTKISDATLIDTADSRLSDSRAPSGSASGDLGGSYPGPTVNDGADSTAIHDNVSGEIAAIANLANPVVGDRAVIEDSNSGDDKASITLGVIPLEGNVTGTAENTVVEAFTIANEVQGSVLYRNASVWVHLAPGTAGQHFETGGAAANPSWEDQALSASYLQGLKLTIGADTDHDIDVATGSARDSADGDNLVQGGTLVKQIDAAFAEGTAAGGMDTGSVATDTWYHCHLIGGAGKTTDMLFSLSVASPTMPSGFTFRRRIGAVLTDAVDTGNILNFTQDGDEFRFGNLVVDVSTVNPGTSAVSSTLSTPLGVVTRAICHTVFDDGTAGTRNNTATFSSLADTDQAPTGSTRTHFISTIAPTCATGIQEQFIRTNTSSQIRYRIETSDADVTVQIITRGYLDRRGQDA